MVVAGAVPGLFHSRPGSTVRSSGTSWTHNGERLVRVTFLPAAALLQPRVMNAALVQPMGVNSALLQPRGENPVLLQGRGISAALLLSRGMNAALLQSRATDAALLQQRDMEGGLLLSRRPKEAPQSEDTRGVVLPRCSAQDFFQSDVVEYGSRYNRPDRFPRLRQADRTSRDVDVLHWLGRLAAASSFSGFGDVPLPECTQAVHGSGWAPRARQLQLLVRQGRLEEALRLAEGWGLREPPSRAQAPAETPSGAESAPPTARLDHGQVLLAAVDAGDVALAFEYAGLLPPRMDHYCLLMAAYAVRGDVGAVRLGLSTARRRGIRPTPLSLLVLAAAAARVGEHEQLGLALEEARSEGVDIPSDLFKCQEVLSGL